MLLKNVHLLNNTPLTQVFDIRIQGDKIIQVGQNLSEEKGEKLVQGKGRIALPGLIDSHRHAWQAPFAGYAANMMLMEYLDRAVGGLGSQLSPEDFYTINLYGYLQAAAKGITTVFDWCHALNTSEHADAALNAAVDAGINVLFFHSTPATDRNSWWYNSTRPHDVDIERLVSEYGKFAPRVKIGMGIRGPEFATMDVNKKDIELARSLGIPISMHIGSSVLGNLVRPVEKLADAGLLGADLNLVHCTVLSNDEFSLIEQAGCLVSSTPEAELQMGLGDPIADRIADHEGLKWAIGLDIVTASADNLFYQQQLLLQLYRGAKNRKLIAQNSLPMDIHYLSNNWFTDSMKHAATFFSGNVSVQIETGAQANIALLDWDELEPTFFKHYPSFHYLHPGNVSTVIAGGKVLFDDKTCQTKDMETLKDKVTQIARRLVIEQ